MDQLGYLNTLILQTFFTPYPLHIFKLFPSLGFIMVEDNV